MSVKALVGEYRENNSDGMIRLKAAERAALSWAAIEEHDSVLDLNAGDGALIKLLNGSLRLRLCGICDSDRQMADLRDAADGAAFTLRPARGLPYRDNSFHVVMCAGGTSMLSAPGTFSEIHRVMRPGGQLVLTDSVIPGLFSLRSRALMRELQEIGFKNVSCRVCGLARVIMAWRKIDLPDRPLRRS